jgi:hypothetical protein
MLSSVSPNLGCISNGNLLANDILFLVKEFEVADIILYSMLVLLLLFTAVAVAVTVTVGVDFADADLVYLLFLCSLSCCRNSSGVVVVYSATVTFPISSVSKC